MTASTRATTDGDFSLTTPTMIEMRDIFASIGVESPSYAIDMAPIDAELARRAFIVGASTKN